MANKYDKMSTDELSQEFDRLVKEMSSLHQAFKRLANSVTCGYCGEITTVDSFYTCHICGRILCEKCGKKWGWCDQHIPKCTHYPYTNFYAQKETVMTGSCQHNMICPVCGYGWASQPCSCKKDI